MIDLKDTHTLRAPLFTVLLVCTLLLLGVSSIQAEQQDNPTAGPVASTLLETITKNLETLESDKSKNNEASEELKSLYRQAIANIENSKSLEKVTAGFIREKQEVPDQIQALLEKTAEARSTSLEQAVREFRKLRLEELESTLLKEKADLAAFDANLTKNHEALKYHEARPQAIRQRLIEANAEAEGIASGLQQPLVAGESVSLNEAKHWVRETRAILLSSEINMLDEELVGHLERIDMIKTRIEHSETSIRLVNERIERLESLIDASRSTKASKVQQETRRSRLDTEDAHELLQKLAANNTELGLQIGQYTIELKQSEKEADQTSEQVKQIDKDHKKAQQKLDIAGMSKILGRVLREQRRALPDTRQYRKRVKELETRIADISLQQLEFKEEYQNLRDLDRSIDEHLTSVSAQDRLELNEPLAKLLTDRRKYLSQLVAIQDSYIRAMSELDFAQTRLLEAADGYNDFLAEHLLWIRSAPPSSFASLRVIPSQVLTLLAPESWKTVLTTFWKQAGSGPEMLLILLVFTLLTWKKPIMLFALAGTANAVGKPSKDSILYTLQGLIWSILLALPWPLLMFGAGWQLQADISGDVFTKAVSLALVEIAEPLFILQAFRLMCEKNGVASMHFRWPENALNLLRVDFSVLMWTTLPLGFINIIVLNASFPGQEIGLARLTFVLIMLSLTWFLYRVLNPATGAIAALSTPHRKNPLTGIRYAWILLTLLIPVIAALMAMAGYLYTAGALVENLLHTMWLALVVISAHQFVLRWLIVIRGRLLLQAAREKRKAAREAALSEKEGLPEQGISSPLQEEKVVDIKALSEDSLSLLNLTIAVFAGFGLWMIWSDIIPALGVFNQVALYHHSVEVGGETILKSTTLADIGQTLLILVVMILLVRRLPAFLEILLRQGRAVSSGSVYAIKSLTSYALIGIGLMLIFNQLGGAWSDFQWIIAALGVGIGFGLQEIVANFISGLIILFERPIRVGDIVTVGEISGKVTRIQIRATTILDWNRKELLVPNKEFITSRLLNWSLSDSVTRLSTTVGVAYGSNIDLAMRLVHEAALENEMIIDTPPPEILFSEFGDSALNIVARVFIDNLDYRVKALSELNRAINSKFADAGIEIAFPQRDVHLDTSRPLDVRLAK